MKITLASSTSNALSSIVASLAINVSYVPVTAASLVVLVDGYCLPVPGYKTLTYPGAPACPLP